MRNRILRAVNVILSCAYLEIIALEGLGAPAPFPMLAAILFYALFLSVVAEAIEGQGPFIFWVEQRRGVHDGYYRFG